MRTFERDFVYVGYLSILIKLEIKIEKSLKYKPHILLTVRVMEFLHIV